MSIHTRAHAHIEFLYLWGHGVKAHSLQRKQGATIVSSQFKLLRQTVIEPATVGLAQSAAAPHLLIQQLPASLKDGRYWDGKWTNAHASIYSLGPRLWDPVIVRSPEGKIKAGGRAQIYHGPMAMEAVKQHPRERSKRSEKRRLWTEIQTKTRCSVQTRSPPWRGEPRVWEAKSSPRRVGILPQFRLMRLSVIPKRPSRQERCICGSSRVAAGAGCRSSSSNLLLAFSGEGLPVHRLQAAGCSSAAARFCSCSRLLLLQPHAVMSILEETKLLSSAILGKQRGGGPSLTRIRAVPATTSCRSRRRLSCPSCSDLPWWIY